VLGGGGEIAADRHIFEEGGGILKIERGSKAVEGKINGGKGIIPDPKKGRGKGFRERAL